jgi:hypothetical protein
VQDSAVESRKRNCPACSVATVTLPLFTTRRRHPVTCINCGAKLERVLPGVPYYTLAFLTGMLIEAAVPVGLILAIFQQWSWIAVIVASLLLFNLAVSAFLNSRTRVEYADIQDARRDQPGRWYPS